MTHERQSNDGAKPQKRKDSVDNGVIIPVDAFEAQLGEFSRLAQIGMNALRVGSLRRPSGLHSTRNLRNGKI